jgi:agmatinase
MPVDNAVALQQMTSAMLELGSRLPALDHPSFPHPKLLTLGGDHSIALGALRAISQVYNQPMAVLHFDSHLDTWIPPQEGHFPWWSEQGQFNHGSMFWFASVEGLIRNGSSVHAGLRTRLSGLEDLEDDDRQGFMRIAADDIDELGAGGIASTIIKHIGTEVPVYLSIDIDVMDPGLCPGTGTPEPGGWTSREMIKVLGDLEPLNVVGADIVEVAPVYDGEGEQTSLVAAQIAYEILTNWILKGTAALQE